LDDLQAITIRNDARRELGWHNRFAIVFDHHAAREQVLRNEPSFDRARELGFNLLTIGDDQSARHVR
ncbi:MAG TPA: hypothetical protein VK530_18230, partial [Candidatus Acidoferrum sp.]|nr:hypothetical protein [Candidatus Acidoferrum sp.]